MISYIGFVSLFGNGQDLHTFTKSKLTQFETSLQKITEVNEEVEKIVMT